MRKKREMHRKEERERWSNPLPTPAEWTACDLQEFVFCLPKEVFPQTTPLMEHREMQEGKRRILIVFFISHPPLVMSALYMFLFLWS
ncbi:hypothetical protein TNCT_289731 [Trichonephila clavata]|uniref:Uncharacterized protein n=1 Tax=Trichonephila clavata TaxID=2740835 RepID=A0A8X6G2V3_TRICU|nr:hypothetical protein TNCT_289731 [Trichonephila clavata]